MSNMKNRGFASMDREKQREIARKGGLAVSQNREHMSKIGKMGGRPSRPEELTIESNEQETIHREGTERL